MESKKRTRPKETGKGKAVEVIWSKKDRVVDTSAPIKRDPKLAKVSVDQLVLDLRIDAAMVESHVLSIPSLIHKVQARCTELEHRYNEAQVELQEQREEALKRYREDGDEINQLKEKLKTVEEELERERSRRTQASNDITTLKKEKREVEVSLQKYWHSF